MKNTKGFSELLNSSQILSFTINAISAITKENCLKILCGLQVFLLVLKERPQTIHSCTNVGFVPDRMIVKNL